MDHPEEYVKWHIKKEQRVEGIPSLSAESDESWSLIFFTLFPGSSAMAGSVAGKFPISSAVLASDTYLSASSKSAETL